MAKTYRRKKLSNGRVAPMKTLVDSWDYNCFVILHKGWRFYTDNQKVPNFKFHTDLENKVFRHKLKRELATVKSLEDAENLVLNEVKPRQLHKYTYMID